MKKAEKLIAKKEEYWTPNWPVLLISKVIKTRLMLDPKKGIKVPLVLHSPDGEDVLPPGYRLYKRYPTEEHAKISALSSLVHMQKELLAMHEAIGEKMLELLELLE